MEFRLSSGECIYVDEDIAVQIEGQAWRGNSKQQVRRSYWEHGKVMTQSLHEIVMGKRPSRGFYWKHLDDDWRNFNRENLVLATKGSWLTKDPEKQKEWIARGASKGGRNGGIPNANGFRGVHKIGSIYRALARVNGKQKYLGSSKTAEGAAKLYDEAMVAQGLPPVNFPHGGASQAEELALKRREQIARREQLKRELEILDRELDMERKRKENRLKLLEAEITQLKEELAEP